MKEIRIFSSGNNPIDIKDENNESLTEYSRRLVKVLESNNISILHTSSSSVIIRPNVISVVVVTETEDIIKEKPEEKIEKTEIFEEPEDIISLEE